MQDVYNLGAHMDTSFNIYQHNESVVSIVNTPWQHLKPEIKELAARTRTKSCKNTGREATNLTEIDNVASTVMFQKLDKEKAALLREPMIGSSWFAATLYHSGKVDSPICNLCDMNVEQALDHVVWKCTCFNQQRRGKR